MIEKPPAWLVRLRKRKEDETKLRIEEYIAAQRFKHLEQQIEFSRRPPLTKIVAY